MSHRRVSRALDLVYVNYNLPKASRLVFSKWPRSRSRIFLNVSLTSNYELPAARHRSPVVRGSSRDFSRRSREMGVVNRLGRNDREYFSLFFFHVSSIDRFAEDCSRTDRKMRLFRWMYLCRVFKTVVVCVCYLFCYIFTRKNSVNRKYFFYACNLSHIWNLTIPVFK